MKTYFITVQGLNGEDPELIILETDKNSQEAGTEAVGQYRTRRGQPPFGYGAALIANVETMEMVEENDSW